MKKELIYIFMFGIVIVIILFFLTVDNKKNIAIISDGNHNEIYKEDMKIYLNNNYKNKISLIYDDFIIDNITAKEFYNLIINNSKIKENSLSIKQIISKSDSIIISIGNYELNMNSNIKLYLYYMEKIIIEIKKNGYSDILLIGAYSNKKNLNIVNQDLENLSNKYDITFVNPDSYMESSNKLYEKIGLEIFGK